MKNINWCRAYGALSTIVIIILATMLTFKQKEIAIVDSGPSAKEQNDYDKLKTTIQQQQELWAEEWEVASEQRQKEILQESGAYVTEQLTKNIFKAWYGTPWDYSGTTQIPRQGQIACGYFVSTTLLHAGFEVERVTLAQQASSNIIKTLCAPSTIKIFKKVKPFKNYISQQADGLYLVGLSKHVGFLWKKKNKLFFIHSSASNGKKTHKESFDKCRSLQKSRTYVVGHLFPNNDWLMEKWLNTTKIKTIK
ncbi:MAG: hypothetical protein MK212_11385 [Saprospiraceae bacterium]|nr:hypothetical protein [Saprospiraceae bacterium]